MGITPSQPVAVTAQETLPAASAAIPPRLLDELWEQCDAAVYRLSRGAFEAILLQFAEEQNCGQPAGQPPVFAPSPDQLAAYLRSLRLSELVLARACAAGDEDAWQHFLAQYQQPLIRAAIAITRSETLGRELADALYAELYGLNLRDGERRCPLHSYHGRGSLIGWLRTILAQRHVDHHRRTGREQSLDDETGTLDPPASEPAPAPAATELDHLGRAVEAALLACEPEERFLLASYYLDQRTLLQIARVLHVHEATVSRKLRRLTDALRKDVLRHLQSQGLSKRAAQEALGTDPRDLTGGGAASSGLELNLRKLLQTSPPQTFPEKAGS